MKIWLLFGIIGFILIGIISIFLFASSGPFFFTGASGWEFITGNPVAPIFLIILFLFFGGIGFAFGSLIGLMYEKIKSRK